MTAMKLAALDNEDLSILAAHTQDAVLKVGDIDWRPREKRLILQLNRFVWEASERDAKSFERRRSILHFARVSAVKSANIRRDAPEAVLNLLTIRYVETDAPAGQIFLDFSGGGSLRLDVECVEAGLADSAAVWSTESKPAHAD